MNNLQSIYSLRKCSQFHVNYEGEDENTTIKIVHCSVDEMLSYINISLEDCTPFRSPEEYSTVFPVQQKIR